MIHDLLLRWIVTALFVISAAECVYAVVTGTRSLTHVVGQLLHFLMAVAMAVMAWPRGAELPTTNPMVFFLLATLWFVGITLAESGHRLVNGYHAAMMLAMSWMYAVMSGSLVAAPAEGASGGDGMSSMPGMPGMEMPGISGSDVGATPPFITGLNWLCTVGFAAAAIWWLYLLFARRRAEPTAPATHFFGIACQAMMAAGMAVMFGVML